MVECKNCDNTFTGKYCNECGEKLYSEKDKKLSHLFEEGFHFLTHFEGKFLLTLKTILRSPGKLSFDYCLGIRKKYFKPISFFLLLVILYLLFPLFEGLNMKLKFYEDGLYGNYVKRQEIRIMQKKSISYEQFAEKYQAKQEKNSKLLLLILLPITALITWAFTFDKRKLYYDQVVFATELNSFYLFWGFLILPLLVYFMLDLYQTITGSQANISELTIGIVMAIPIIFYLAIAAKKFYKISWLRSILTTLIIIFIHQLMIQVVYKFILFNVTILMI